MLYNITFKDDFQLGNRIRKKKEGLHVLEDIKERFTKKKIYECRYIYFYHYDFHYSFCG